MSQADKAVMDPTRWASVSCNTAKDVTPPSLDFKISRFRKKNIEVPKYVELQAKGSIMAGGEILQHTCHDRPWKS